MAGSTAPSSTTASGRRRGSVWPTRRGGVVLATAVVVLLAAGRFDLPALLPVSGLLLGLLALGLLAVLLAPARVRVTRTAGAQVLDHSATGIASIRIENRSFLPALEGEWSDRLPGALGGPVDGALPVLGVRGSAEVSYRLMGVRRGRHTMGRVTVLVRDPFGLFERRHHTHQTLEVVVLPRRTPLPAVPGIASGGSTSGRPIGRRRGGGEDDVVSRVYQPGDAPKRIDWRTSARRGELMVRQDEQAAADRVAVAVDPGMNPVVSEWALVAAASALAHLTQQGHAVTTIVPGCAPRVLVPGRDVLQDALVDLAGLAVGPRPPIGPTPGDGRTVVAMLGAVGVDRASEWVAGLRGADRVMALVAEPSGPEAIRVLTNAGWQVVTWRVVDDVADRWSALGRKAARASS